MKTRTESNRIEPKPSKNRTGTGSISRWQKPNRIKSLQGVHRHQFRDFDDYERYASSSRVLNFEHDLLSTQRTKQIDVHLLHDVLEIHFCQRFREFDDRNETKHRQIVLQNKQQTSEHFVLERILRSQMLF